ncbi:MAG: LamG-like jellyroll fold domain-containing protein, partial [bacterium]|nr:LamG-like jellyroll fold domain-containing protein [bacterium]
MKTVTGKTQIRAGIPYLFQGYFDAGAGAIYIYVNGVRESSTGSVGASISNEPSNFYFGATKVGSSAFNYFFNGNIDEFRLFSGTRSEGSFAYSKRRGEPVAKIPFDDASGVQAFDNSYYDNRGGLVNFPTDNSQWQSGFYNYTLQFDGTNDYVDLGSRNSLQLGKAITISAWINLSSLGNYTIVSQPHTSGYTFALTSAGEMTFGALGGTTVTSSGAGISANDWTHIVVSYDGSKVYFYKDGRVISSGVLPLWSVTTGGVFVGRAGSTPNYFSGKMDNLLIYPYNRTLFEVYTDLSGGAIVLGRQQELRPANAELACPSGYVWVSGDPLFGTNDFCVMKYEAKYDCTGDGTGDTAAACSALADSGLGLDWRDVAQASSSVVSTADGAPIVHITHPQAVSACPSGTHLITNDEWMTIARNAASMASNWADNAIGSTVVSSGGLKRGNVGIIDSVSYNGTDPEYGTGRDAKAKLTLSNGQEIWDISGNVWEHVRRDENDTLTDSLSNDGGASGWRWIEFTAIT